MISNWIRTDYDVKPGVRWLVLDTEPAFYHWCWSQSLWLATPWACLNTMSQCAYTGPEPGTNWSHAARHLVNSASDRLTDECLVPLTHRWNDRSSCGIKHVREPLYVFAVSAWQPRETDEAGVLAHGFRLAAGAAKKTTIANWFR